MGLDLLDGCIAYKLDTTECGAMWHIAQHFGSWNRHHCQALPSSAHSVFDVDASISAHPYRPARVIRAHGKVTKTRLKTCSAQPLAIPSRACSCANRGSIQQLCDWYCLWLVQCLKTAERIQIVVWATFRNTKTVF